MKSQLDVPQRTQSSKPKRRPFWERNKEASFEPKRTRFALPFFLIALILGVLAFSISNYVLNSIAARSPGIKLDTVVATQKIPAGAIITPAMFKVSSFPTLYRPADAAQSPRDVVGRVANFTIPADVPITTDALSAPGSPATIAGLLQKGGVAFFLPDSALVEPVPVGLVNQYDYVDLYVAGFPVRQSSTDANSNANPIIACVPILDPIGAEQNVPQNIINAPSAGAGGSTGFVVEMTPGQVSGMLYYIQAGGRLAMVIDRYDACTGHN